LRVIAVIAKSEQLQGELWSQVIAASAQDARSVSMGLYL
jgi:hypothetical protein